MSGEFLWAEQADPARLDAMMTRSTRENFPVALRMLPARHRRHLMAVYGFARITDDIGDEAPPAERPRMLTELEEDLARLSGGQARLPVIRALEPTVRELGVPIQPFLDLIAANRQDQIVTRYPTFEDLLGYCKLSANPVGRIVLYVFGAFTPERAELSDQVCTALQLAEHWQDVAEDYQAGRIYLPGEDLDRYQVTEADLAGPAAGPRLRELMTFETRRARRAARRRRAAGRHAAGHGPAGRGRIRGRRSRGPGLDRGGRLRRPVRDPDPRPSPGRDRAAADGGDRTMRTTQALATDVRAAYEHCEQVTKTQARNFSYGITLLPGDKRRALSAVYAYARRIDDIGDGDLPPADKLTALAQARDQITGLVAGAAPPDDDLVLRGAGRRGRPVRRSRWPPSSS